MIFTSIAIIFTSGLLFGVHVAPDRMSEVKECIEMQTDLYSDICAESSSGYENMTGSDAHFDGVTCATESVKICLDIYQE